MCIGYNTASRARNNRIALLTLFKFVTSQRSADKKKGRRHDARRSLAWNYFATAEVAYTVSPRKFVRRDPRADTKGVKRTRGR